jgi:fructosamine-3-kinase
LGDSKFTLGIKKEKHLWIFGIIRSIGLQKKLRKDRMYEATEVNDVIKDMNKILDKFEVTLDLLTADLHVANKNLNSRSALGYLVAADMKLKEIDLIPVIDTLYGIIEDNDNGAK